MLTILSPNLGRIRAITVREVMNVVVVWLLKIPSLLLAGGALLVWIAYKLLADNDNNEHNVSPALISGMR